MGGYGASGEGEEAVSEILPLARGVFGSRAVVDLHIQWRQSWKPGERILPHNFGSGRDYRGGNAVCLTMQALDRGYADPRWGGYRQIQEAGGHVRKGEKGTPIQHFADRRIRHLLEVPWRRLPLQAVG